MDKRKEQEQDIIGKKFLVISKRDPWLDEQEKKTRFRRIITFILSRYSPHEFFGVDEENNPLLHRTSSELYEYDEELLAEYREAEQKIVEAMKNCTSLLKKLKRVFPNNRGKPKGEDKEIELKLVKFDE